MTRWLRRWPPVVWILVYVGSIFVLMGSQRFSLLVVGLGIIALAFGIALHLASRREPGRPPPAPLWAILGGIALFYLVAAAVAAPLGAAYAIAALLASLIPMTAVTLAFATARNRTHASGGRLHDPTAEEEDDPLPAVGMDDATPLGDTPEAHDEISPHDLPKDHPGRRAAERQARRSDGVTHGDRA
jgi:hypothetical protein